MKYITATIIALALIFSVKPAMAYIVAKWLDYTQITMIAAANNTVHVELYKVQDSTTTCYVLIGKETNQQSLACLK